MVSKCAKAGLLQEHMPLPSSVLTTRACCKRSGSFLPGFNHASLSDLLTQCKAEACEGRICWGCGGQACLQDVLSSLIAIIRDEHSLLLLVNGVVQVPLHGLGQLGALVVLLRWLVCRSSRGSGAGVKAQQLYSRVLYQPNVCPQSGRLQH